MSEESVESTHGHRPDPPVPGPCGPYGCPEPTELVCIQVDKIYDACSQRHCFENIRFNFTTSCDEVTCRVVPGSFNFDCILTQVQTEPPLVRAALTFSFVAEATCGTQTRRVTVHSEDFIGVKQVILFGVADEMFCKVEAVVECLGCDVFTPPTMGTSAETAHHDATVAECDFGIFLEVKTAADVQLLIPSYGFCPVPPECQELPTRCDEFLTGPAPRRFPRQPFEFVDPPHHRR